MAKRALTPTRHDDVEFIAQKTIGENYGQLVEFTLRHKRFNGTWTPPINRDCFDSGPAVIVLPYEPKTDQVVLVKQFRMGPWVAGAEPWMFECPAGRLDKGGASPEDIARAEAHEEAGLEVTALHDFGRFFTSPGVFTETIQAYCGRVAEVQSGVFGLDSENEDILAEAMSADSAIEMALSGAIVSGPTLVCLLKFAAQKAAIRAAWA